MAFDFAVSRITILPIQHVHGGLEFDLVARLGFLSVERLGQLRRNQDAGRIWVNSSLEAPQVSARSSPRQERQRQEKDEISCAFPLQYEYLPAL